MNDHTIRLVVLDWAGTAVDFGSFAPVEPFRMALSRRGIDVSTAAVRKPMGLPKKDHLRALLSLEDASEQWRIRHGSAWTEADLDEIYSDYVGLQIDAVAGHSRLVPGLIAATLTLRERGIKIATTTGYFREAATIVFEAADRQGYVRDCDVLPDEVASGRPAPWMIFRAMEATGIYPPADVLKVGDTVADIEEGRNAGVWSVGVLVGGSEVGMSEAEWGRSGEKTRRAIVESARSRFHAAGAHAVIETIGDLPKVVAEIESRRFHGESPDDLPGGRPR